MKVLNCTAFALALIVCAPVALAAPPDKSGEMWKRFYAQLATVCRGGDENKNEPMMLCLRAPGIPLRPLDSSNPSDVTYVNQLLDVTAQYNPKFTPGNMTFSSIWRKIIDNHDQTPAKALSASDQAKYDKALALTDSDNPTMQKYEKWQAAVDAAVVAKEAAVWQNRINAKVTPPVPAISLGPLDSALISAKNKWKGEGKQGDVDAAFGVITKFSNNDPETWWDRLDKRLTKAEVADTVNVVTFPPMDLWASEDGWLKFTYRASEKASSSSLNTMDVQASASLNVGGFSGSASGGYTSEKMNSLASDESLVITMEIKKVIIVRPFVDWSVFTSQTWTLPKTLFPAPGISDGKGGGVLPLYTTAFFIVRKVVFSAESIKEFQQRAMQDIHAEMNASYGPFSMSASFRKRDENQSAGESKNLSSIEIPDPQIIGYECTKVPKCPTLALK